MQVVSCAVRQLSGARMEGAVHNHWKESGMSDFKVHKLYVCKICGVHKTIEKIISHDPSVEVLITHPPVAHRCGNEEPYNVGVAEFIGLGQVESLP